MTFLFHLSIKILHSDLSSTIQSTFLWIISIHYGVYSLIFYFYLLFIILLNLIVVFFNLIPNKNSLKLIWTRLLLRNESALRYITIYFRTICIHIFQKVWMNLFWKLLFCQKVFRSILYIHITLVIVWRIHINVYLVLRTYLISSHFILSSIRLVQWVLLMSLIGL